MRVSLLFLTGLLLVGRAADTRAATDRELYQKQVAKVAPPADAKPKALCACSFDTGAGFANRVGFIRQQLLNNQVFVQCAGEVFDIDGNDVGSFSCTNFYPLVR